MSEQPSQDAIAAAENITAENALGKAKTQLAMINQPMPLLDEQFAKAYGLLIAENNKLRALAEQQKAEIDHLRKDAERFMHLQSIDPKQAQAYFWNYSSRKERAKGIDAAIASTKANTATPVAD